MTTFTLDHPNSLPTLPLSPCETPAPVACWHCAATQATVRRGRQVLDARLGYPTNGVCCDCETGNACPQCLSQNLAYGTYDLGTDGETGYADSGERYSCRDCGATGDLDDTAATLVMLPQPMRKPVTRVPGPADLPEVA